MYSSVYNGSKKGPSLLVIGGVHGNELPGQKAVACIDHDLRHGKVNIERGQVILIPHANPQACKEKKRYTKENLNRVFQKTLTPKTYEQKLANMLCEFVDQSDIVIDIHSFAAPGLPFVFIDYPTKQNKALARALGVDHAIFGWAELYSMHDQDISSYKAEQYTYEQGKTGITLECGKNTDIHAYKFAYTIILNAMRHINLISGRHTYISQSKNVVLKKLYMRRDEKDCFVKDWRNFDVVSAGQHIATRSNGSKIISPIDGYMILPKTHAFPNEEWFYLGIPKNQSTIFQTLLNSKEMNASIII